MPDHAEEFRYEPIPLPDRTELPPAEMLARAEAFYRRIRTRHTVREFSDRPVPREIIETCLRAAGTAPNGANHQPWHFVAISDSAMKHRIRDAAEEEERRFYDGGAGSEWLKALEPIGTSDRSNPGHRSLNIPRLTCPWSSETPLARWASRSPM